ncbi:hypothetical protein PHLGIDRAFT_416314 [Phlebiopsis gigantea 11061_1 CR5-6]|uniref:Uncharacterized protein n=1 Tax=Phlebiopsis gigantea (strain 11061_1 CR5-6) TaxID=745531 RepID=A0A0C3SFB6_PHLG1|nr:hypothetical protein PHLGIDRAFT_416314 [Phlebiopsis gigantea 11061_1 CR5-6]
MPRLAGATFVTRDRFSRRLAHALYSTARALCAAKKGPARRPRSFRGTTRGVAHARKHRTRPARRPSRDSSRRAISEGGTVRYDLAPLLCGRRLRRVWASAAGRATDVRSWRRREIAVRVYCDSGSAWDSSEKAHAAAAKIGRMVVLSSVPRPVDEFGRGHRISGGARTTLRSTPEPRRATWRLCPFAAVPSFCREALVRRGPGHQVNCAILAPRVPTAQTVYRDRGDTPAGQH